MPIKITDYIDVFASGDNYSTHKALLGHGGFRSVDSIIERDNIPMDRQEVGMWVNVIGDTVYELGNTGWFQVTGIGSTGGLSEVLTGPTITGDGISNPLNIPLSTDSNNVLSIGTDDRLFVDSGINTDMFNTDLSLDTSRTHDLNDNNLIFNNTGDNSIVRFYIRDSSVGLNLAPSGQTFGGESYVGANQVTDTVTLKGDVLVRDELRLCDADVNYIGFSAPNSLSVDTSYVLPTGDGILGQVLTTDGTGNLIWANVSSTGSGSFNGVITDDTLDGDGNLIDLGVSFSTDSNNIISTGTDGAVYSSGLALQDEFNGDPGDVIRWVEGTPQLTKLATVYVDDYPGTNLTEKFNAAMSGTTFNTRGGRMVLPGGYSSITETMLLASPGTLTTSKLFESWTIEGGDDTVIWWADDTGNYENKAMMEIPAANQISIENIKFIGRKISTSTDVSGTIGLYVRPAFDYNGNTARGMNFHRLKFTNCDIGFYLGDWSGPDFTAISIKNCTTSSCITGMAVAGANIASTTFENCSLNGGFASWKLLYATVFNFDAGEFKDPWGVSVPQDWTDSATYPSGTTQWNLRVIDSSGTTRGQPGFISGEAKNIGGGPNINIINCDASPDKTITGPHYVIDSLHTSVAVKGLRIEGPESAIMKTVFTSGNPNLMDSTRSSILEDISVSHGNYPAIEIQHTGSAPGWNAGRPLIIRDCKFKSEIPEQSLYEDTFIKYDGRVVVNDELVWPLEDSLTTGTVTDGSLTGNGYSNPLGINVSLDAGNAIVFGTDSGIFAPTGTGGGATEDTNFSTNNLIFSTNRLHELAGNTLTIQDGNIILNPNVDDGLSLLTGLLSLGSSSGALVQTDIANDKINLQSTNGINLLSLDGAVQPVLFHSTGINTVSLQSPDTMMSDISFVLPTGDGSNGQLLTTNGSGQLSFAEDISIQQHAWTAMASEAVVELNGVSPSQTTTLTSDQLLTFSGTAPVGKDRTYYAEITHTGDLLTISGINDPGSLFTSPGYSPFIVAFKLTSSGIPRFAGVI